jgi:hypothetical protein
MAEEKVRNEYEIKVGDVVNISTSDGEYYRDERVVGLVTNPSGDLVTVSTTFGDEEWAKTYNVAHIVFIAYKQV